MKKRLFAVPMVAVAGVCLSLLAGCNAGPAPEEVIKKDLESQFADISADNEDFIASIEEGGGEDMKQLGIDSAEFGEAYLDGFTYEIGDITVDDKEGTATAVVTVEMKTMADILTDFQADFEEQLATLDMSTIESQDDLFKLGGEILMQSVKDAEPQEAECEFEYEKNDEGAWEIQDSAADELINAMM